MDGAASTIAVIQLAGSIVKICRGYIGAVKDAKEDINNLQQEVVSLTEILKKLLELLQSPDGIKVPATQTLGNDITKCFSTLTALEEKLDPGKRKKVMRKLGRRALTWPLKHEEVEKAIRCLERYKTSFILALQIDQTAQVAGMVQSTNLIDQKIDLAKIPIAKGAEFDSYMDQHEDECHPETRIELRHQIADWAVSSHGKCIFWLNGMAGTGKSTISRTVARSFKEKGLLGASFFFKRGEGDRGNATKFFSTITAQLMTRFPQLKPADWKIIEDDPGIPAKSLKEQFEKLLLQPLFNLKQSDQHTPTMVIIIDALDECEREEDIRVILQLLPRVQELSSICLRVLLTSRPELPIRLGFRQIGKGDHHDLVLHEIPKPVIQHDISLFLKDRFSKIRQDRLLSTDWPGDDKIQALVKITVPLFIFAATVCRFVGDMKWDPQKRLAMILEDQAVTYVSKMDRTYLPILNQLLAGQDEQESEQLVKEFHEIVGVIILLATPLSVRALARLLDIPEDDISNRLDSLHSVLSIPSSLDAPVRLLHLSFRDFLLDSNHKGKSPFWVDEKEMHQKIALQCLSVMRRSLTRNICKLPSYGTQRGEIDAQAISQCLSADLQYSCRYWAHHLEQSRLPVTHKTYVFSFLQEHFLHWLESMCILGIVSEAVGIIQVLQSVLQADTDSDVSKFLHDAKRFILKNMQIADSAPLQIYCSGLVFAPEKTMIRRIFEKSIPNSICKLPKVEEAWSADLQTLEGHSDWVWTAVFSPDGRLVASSSDDKTIKLWDAATGALQETLEGHLDSVRTVVFSPDGKLVASGSDDETVKLWDVATGTLQYTLQGHSDAVRTVAFSPDGKLVASGSGDKMVKLWDATTGTLQQTLEGHSHWVRSVVFSPDGRLLASGSGDKMVKLWVVATGALQQTLDGHLGSVRTVVFAPDGRLLASSSADKTIKLWDAATGALQQTLEGHSSWVCTVVFSPDGKLVASGSGDKMVKLWDVATGTLQHTLQGHSGWVSTVLFSPDGRLIASGSGDGTVKLWDATTGALQHTLPIQGLVTSLSFSKHGPCLDTNLGSFDIQPWYSNYESILHQANIELSTNDQWVALQNENILWLPPEYRPVCWAVEGGTLVLGHASGRVSFMKFCT